MHILSSQSVSLPMIRRNTQTKNVGDFGWSDLSIGFLTACNDFDTPTDYSDDLRADRFLLLLLGICYFRYLSFDICRLNTRRREEARRDRIEDDNTVLPYVPAWGRVASDERARLNRRGDRWWVKSRNHFRRHRSSPPLFGLLGSLFRHRTPSRLFSSSSTQISSPISSLFVSVADGSIEGYVVYIYIYIKKKIRDWGTTDRGRGKRWVMNYRNGK